MRKEEMQEKYNDVMDDILYGSATAYEVSHKYGIPTATLYRWVDERKAELACHHPRCEECRAYTGKGGKGYCTALTNTDFGDRRCPFFSTKKGFVNRFWNSNKKKDVDLIRMQAEGYDVKDTLILE